MLLHPPYAMCGTELAYAATSQSYSPPCCDGLGTSYPISLRVCYAMSGTGIAYVAMLSCYAYAVRCPVLAWRMVLLYTDSVWCKGIKSTELAYCATGYHSRGQPQGYAPTVCCYGVSGTEIAYGAMR
eukprot:2909804-Rhodomonas_salina.1